MPRPMNIHEIPENQRCQALRENKLPCKNRAMNKTLKAAKRFCHLHNPDNARPRPVLNARIAREDTQIAQLIGQNFSVHEIAEKTGLHVSTVYDRIAVMADFLRKSDDAKNEAVMQIIRVKQEALRMAYSDFAVMRQKSLGDNGRVDPQIYAGLDRQIKLITETSESLERTLARLGLVPPEPRRIDVSGQVDLHSEAVNIIIHRYEDEAIEGEQKNDGE